MDIRRFIQLAHVRKIPFLLFPLLFGLIYSLYQYDNAYWGKSIILMIAMVCFFLAIHLLKEWGYFQRAEDEQKQKETLVYQLSIDMDELRKWLFILFGASFLLFAVVAFMVGWQFAIFLVVGIFCSIFYVYGKNPWMNTWLSEPIFSFGLGLLLPFIMLLANTWQKTISIGELWMQSTWMMLPLVFTFAIVITAENTVRMQQEEDIHPLVSYLHYSAIDGLLELFLFLAFVLPLFSIYLDLAPWLVVLMWLVFPKAWMDLKKFIQKHHASKAFPYIQEIFEMIMMLQIIVYALGLFF